MLNHREYCIIVAVIIMVNVIGIAAGYDIICETLIR